MQALPLLAPSSVCVMCNSITLLTMMTTKMICQSNWERISHICFDTLPWRQFSRAQRSEWKKKRHKIRLLTTHLHDSHHTQMASEWVGCRWKGQEWRRPMWNGFSVLAVFVCAWFDQKKIARKLAQVYRFEVFGCLFCQSKHKSCSHFAHRFRPIESKQSLLFSLHWHFEFDRNCQSVFVPLLLNVDRQQFAICFSSYLLMCI